MIALVSLFRHVKDFAASKLSGRSPKWPEVRDAHLAKHPTCEVCGGKEKLNVHHIKPFHLFRWLELDPTNLITLCERSHVDKMNCHFIFGHLGDWKAYNPSVATDAAAWLKKFAGRLYR